MAAAVVAFALAGNDEVVLEQVCLAGKPDLLVQIGADAAASLRVEQGEVANDEPVLRGPGSATVTLTPISLRRRREGLLSIGEKPE